MKKRILILATIIPLALMGIVLASSTMNPRITYTGNGLPDPSVGRIGDLYIDLDTSVLYVMGTNGWGIFAVLPTPVNGTNGLNGATWIVGDTNPADNLGSNGDLYFNYASLDIFLKVDGTWIYLTTIAGQQGPTGPQGPAGTDGTNGTNGTDGKDGRNGSTWYNELIAPMTADLGSDGDYYLFANGTAYYKINATWTYFTSLMGPQGPAGPQGETGPKGETGATGATGAVGATGATGPTGPAGAQGIAGANGLDGSDGNIGADGKIGANGSDAPWWVYIILSALSGGIVGSTIMLASKRKDQKQKQAP